MPTWKNHLLTSLKNHILPHFLIIQGFQLWTTGKTRAFFGQLSTEKTRLYWRVIKRIAIKNEVLHISTRIIFIIIIQQRRKIIVGYYKSVPAPNLLTYFAEKNYGKRCYLIRKAGCLDGMYLSPTLLEHFKRVSSAHFCTICRLL